MKTPMKRTVFKVILRKSEYKEQWSLLIESFPVFVPGRDMPMRKHEPLNRFITTPIFDKNSSGRTLSDGKAYYRPKRDTNGIIMCRSQKDQEACIFADNVRNLRQHEYDNQALYSDTDAEQAAQNERSRCDFIKYFEELKEKRHKNSSKSIQVNWSRELALLKLYTEDKPMYFGDIDLNLIEDYKDYLMNAPQGGSKGGIISRNTASTYFSIFKAALHQAFIDGFLTIDLAAKSKNIYYEESQREYLTLEKLNKLASTPCDSPILKRAALFSALTGLRHSDIKPLKWKDLVKDQEHYRILFTQQKTKGIEYMPISDQAYQLCGERGDSDRLIFEGLQDPSWISRPVARWVEAAGITKHITFHIASHSKIFYLLNISELSILKNVTANDLETSYILFLSQPCNIQRTL